MTTADPAMEESFDGVSGTGRLRVSTLRRMMRGLAELGSEETASDGEGAARGRGRPAWSSITDQLPLDLRGDAEPLARVIAATLVAPVLHARVHRRVAGTHAAADIWWSPSASIAVGGHPAASEGGDDPALLVIVAPPTALGEQVVRTLRIHGQPAAADAVASVDPRELAAALLGERTEPLAGVEPAELVLGEVELAAATAPATFDLPEATPSWSMRTPRTLAPRAGDAAAGTSHAPLVRGILTGPAGCWRLVSAEASAPSGSASPAVDGTPLPAVGLQPQAASDEQAFFDEAARRVAHAALATT